MKKMFLLFVISIIFCGCSKNSNNSNNSQKSEGCRIFDIIRDMGPSKKKSYEKVRQNIYEIKLGMTKDEVKKIMGKPVRIFQMENNEITEEWWIFKHPGATSEPPRCVFNEKQGVVIEVVCGDSYRITAKRKGVTH